MSGLRARGAVQTLKEYHPPLGGREGLRLDFNENVDGCSPRVLETLHAITSETLNKYPEREPGERAVAAALGLDAAQVLLTNGVDEAIHLLAECYLEPGDETLVAVPTFSMYEIYALATGSVVRTVQANEALEFPFEQMMRAITPRTRMICIATPNNPTGAIATREQLLAIVQAAPQAAVLIDEAYIHFGGESLMDQIGVLDNLFICRTFSKAYGLAGFRLGALMGSAAQLKMVRRVASPYSVNGIVLTCLEAALDDRDYIAGYAVGNDYGFDAVFSRQVEALAAPGDVVVGISTSGRSANVQRALEAARERGCRTVALLGRDGGSIAPLVELPLVVPVQHTPFIQESHGTIVHILCDLVETRLFPPSSAGQE